MGYCRDPRGTSVLLGSWLWLFAASSTAASQSVFQVKNINTTASEDATPTDLESVNGALDEPSTLFFAANDGLTGTELWKSDGTQLGTTQVKDIVSGPASSGPSHLTRVDGWFLQAGRLFFTADDGVSGVELWTSDGTPAGTHMVKDINGTPAASGLDNLTAVSRGLGPGSVFFTADDGISGVELWISDGTPGGTVRVRDINPTGSSSPANLTAIDGVLFFSAENGVEGRELWKSDGTEAGTVLVKDINVGPGGSDPFLFTECDGRVFFVAFTPTEGQELWRSDGSYFGTVLVKDIRTGFGLSSSPSHLLALRHTLVFQADDGANGRELWQSDGFPGGTSMVVDINPTGSAFTSDQSTGAVVSTGEAVFFRADDGVHGEELWWTNGIGAATVLVKDTYPGPAGGLVDSLTYMNGIVYFVARNAPVGWQLWRSDGREAGTFPVGEIFPGPAGSLPHDLTVAAPFLFFSSWGVEGNELFATDFVFADGFESGATDVWSLAGTDGGDLSVQAAAARHGSFGLSAFVNDTASLFVLDESPILDRRYRARFSLDPNGFDPGESNGRFRVRVFLGRGDSAFHLIALVLRRVGGQYSLMGKVRLDDGTRAQTPFFAITDEPHTVELDWEWSPGIDDSTGRFALWIDELPLASLSGLHTHLAAVQSVQLGAMAPKPGANGTLYFDDFESRRERYIGDSLR